MIVINIKASWIENTIEEQHLLAISLHEFANIIKAKGAEMKYYDIIFRQTIQYREWGHEIFLILRAKSASTNRCGNPSLNKIMMR